MTTHLPAPIFNRIVETACALQQIPSPTFRETEKAAFIQRQFQQAALQDVSIDAAGNVLARIPGGSARPLVISAHIDTVHPYGIPLTLKRTPDRITGPAIGDNSVGAAVLACLPEVLRDRNLTPPGDIWLVGNICEEGLGDLRGMRAVVERFGSQPVAYLILEGMGLGHVYHRGLGVERYRITAHGAGGHSWVDYGKASAIHVIARLVARLSDLRLPTRPRTSLNVGMLQGGTSINTIAAEAWAEVDLRSESAVSLKKLSGQVRAICADADRLEGISIEIETIGQRPAGEIPATHPLVELAKRSLAAEDVLSHLEIASTDANIPLAVGLPAVCFGLTCGARAHTTAEYIEVEPIHSGVGLLIRMLENVWDVIGAER